LRGQTNTRFLLVNMLERFTFKTEYKNTNQYKNAAILSIIISIILILMAAILFDFYSLAYTLGIGAMIYQFYAFFIIFEMSKKKMKIGSHIVTFLMFFLLITAVIMVIKFDRAKIRENPMGLALGFLTIITPVFFWEEFFKKAEKIFKPLLILLLLVPLMIPGYAQNETNGTLQQVSNVLDYAKIAVDYVSGIFGFFGGIQTTIQNMFGLDPGQAQIINIGIILVVLYLFLRTMKWIVKWIILILFVWIALQVIGII